MLHRLADLPGSGRTLRFCQVLAPALVLGSSQPDADIDQERARAHGLDLVRRRSGGGAVLVAPGAQVWADFFLPRSDPLFETDVSRSFLWVGSIWAAALKAVLGPEPQVSLASRATSRAPSLVRSLCFAGLVAGEVQSGGRKLLGCSERRTRSGAWTHTMVVLEGDGGLLPSLLSGPDERRDEACRILEAAMLVPACGRAGAARLSEAVVEALPPL